MTIVYSKNISISATALTDAAAGNGVTGFLYGDARPLYEVKKFLVDSLGYTVTVSSTRTSGTGTVANDVSASDLWTDGYKVAYGQAYCGLKFTYRGVTRRLLLQRSDTTGNFGRFKINRTADYTTSGGATAVRPQTISGEKVWLGSGTDPSPSFAASLPGVDLTMQCLGDTTTGGFVIVGYPPAGSAVGGTGFLLSLDPFADSTYESGADDAALIYTPQTTPTWADLSSESSLVCRAWCKLGLAGADFVGVSMRTALGVGVSPASPRTGAKPLGDLWYGRDASPAELLGKSTMFQAYGPVGSVPRTAKASATKDRAVWGQLVTLWDGTEPS